MPPHILLPVAPGLLGVLDRSPLLRIVQELHVAQLCNLLSHIAPSDRSLLARELLLLGSHIFQIFVSERRDVLAAEGATALPLPGLAALMRGDRPVDESCLSIHVLFGAGLASVE